MSLSHHRVLDWYERSRRNLPWREPGATPWGIFVSEIMLQQTPVGRVEPVWREWMRTWPAPKDLAAASPGDAVRAWGRLGYPRRALRLHAAAAAMVQRHGGRVPADHGALAALPGVGEYTAAAVASFAFGIPVPVVDTNVRRVLARAVLGNAVAAPSLTAAERRLAAEHLPPDPDETARWNVAVMELGALVCTARSPRCAGCPIAGECAWRAAGFPAYDGPVRRGQRWAGTDRQVRGRLLQRLRDSTDPLPRVELDLVWADVRQRERCLAGLIEDGLVEPLPGERFALPA